MGQTDQINALDKLLSTRHSCRGFLPDPIPRETIEQIVRTAQKVPSWCNAQPWQLIITQGAATEDFRTVMTKATTTVPQREDVPFPARYSGIHLERRRICGWQLYEAVGVVKGDRTGSAQQMQRNFSLFDAPHVAIVTSPVELGAYGVLDCGAFVTAFTLAAQALGVASIPQAALAGFSDVVHDHFAIDRTQQVVCGISFGREDRNHPANGFRTTRADVETVVDWR